ncbi:hypothetical protein [Streptomyces sp. NRRL S-15]|uniref:hypothetical protein n=1 Tax=Streptomyces TaxID=1883 RepID=UPI003B640478
MATPGSTFATAAEELGQRAATAGPGRRTTLVKSTGVKTAPARSARISIVRIRTRGHGS